MYSECLNVVEKIHKSSTTQVSRKKRKSVLVQVTPGRKMGMDGRLWMLRFLYIYIYRRLEFLLAVIVILCSLMVYNVKSTHVLFFILWFTIPCYDFTFNSAFP